MTIPFNIWDDFLEGQETHGYTEEYDDLTEKEREEIAEIVFNYIKNLDMTGVEVTLRGEDVYFRGLTYVRLEELVKELQSANLKYKDHDFDFYSES